ncbi:protein kinase [Streptomyces sp. NPDC058382]|uniref:serine/threonine-protein kinase n=1 Tax=unclassified Streptomyces TaxID=2593676 RepID=UPI00362B2A0A
MRTLNQPCRRHQVGGTVGQCRQVGRVIGGRYRIESLLGSGGFGRVWRARDERLNVDVAVKEVEFPLGLSAPERATRLHRAEREARHAAALRDHPNIVTVHDVIIDAGQPWTVMQLIEGGSLADRLKSGPLPVSAAVQVAAALFNALRAAHAAGIVHRDVKPGNVMMAATGEILLADFGIAVRSDDTALTSGGFIGSLPYTAPERLRGVSDLPASDLFSLGVTLYEAVDGISPFRRDSDVATLAAVQRGQAPPPQHAGTLTLLITALMDMEPQRRPTELSAMPNPPSAAYVTPLVKRLAEETGVDLVTVRGTGIGGRIRVQDVRAAASRPEFQ